MINEIRPFEEFKEMIQDTSKDKLIEFIYELLKEKHQLKNDYSKVVHESTEHEGKVYELQEENQRLKEMKYKTLIDLQDRIDRAIECIDSLLPCIHDEELLDDLLKILKGVKYETN